MAASGLFSVSYHCSGDLLLVAVSLPPRHTLLMRVSSSEAQSVVHVLTDVWEVLPLVEEFIHGLQKEDTEP